MDSLAQNEMSRAPAFERVNEGARLASRETAASPVLRARPSRAATANYRSLARLAAFLACLLCLVFALHAAISTGLRRITTSSFGVTNRIVNGQINADVIVTGSSRALVHYDPRILQAATGWSVFNLGRNGSQTDLQLAVLQTYLEHNAKPRLVIHNLDLYAFVTSHEIYDPAQYLPYLSEPALFAAVARVYPDAWKWKYVPLYGYVVPDLRFTWTLGLKRLFGFEPAEDHINGFVPRRLSWTDDFEKFRAAHPDGLDTPVEPQGIRDLEEVATLCRDRGVPLLFVYSPEYAEIQPLQRNRAAIFARFRELADRYGVALWDFSDSPIARHRGYFYNSQHLNAEGAAVFSHALGQRLMATRLFAQTRGEADGSATLPAPSTGGDFVKQP